MFYRFIVIILISLVSKVFAGGALHEEKTAKTVDLRGELKELYSNDLSWKKYIESVKNGDATSLRKWPNLRRASDAGASSELDIAMSNLLKDKFSILFKSLKSGWPIETQRNDIMKSICQKAGETFSEIPGMNQAEMNRQTLNLLNTYTVSLNKNSDISMQDAKRICLFELDSQKKILSQR